MCPPTDLQSAQKQRLGDARGRTGSQEQRHVGQQVVRTSLAAGGHEDRRRRDSGIAEGSAELGVALVERAPNLGAGLCDGFTQDTSASVPEPGGECGGGGAAAQGFVEDIVWRSSQSSASAILGPRSMSSASLVVNSKHVDTSYDRTEATMLQQSNDLKEVSTFLFQLGLGHYLGLFLKHGFDCMEVVQEMQEKHMREIGMALGHILKLKKRLDEVRPADVSAACAEQHVAQVPRSVFFGKTETHEVEETRDKHNSGEGTGPLVNEGQETLASDAVVGREAQPLACIKVHISANHPPERLMLWEGQSPMDVANEFASRHALAPALLERLGWQLQVAQDRLIQLKGFSQPVHRDAVSKVHDPEFQCENRERVCSGQDAEAGTTKDDETEAARVIVGEEVSETLDEVCGEMDPTPRDPKPSHRRQSFGGA